ncbi:methionine--tRNA ligase [Dehalogenimonas etheniformans]|uniref:Methionine--tRNA ligase n=1 Tax=Dehalogenimonas etheniformans TaxID=1536648 RepID=A0A2P5P504_9CHLR|nr:methionine--tRNA ligase [Dehalogenimonas etheniformans]PPD57379.1 methionine--tRNA ligase [Dehalogenimonas etheniformans]QNT75230.1 methionine--tRNA ligase [Dehalogenimonas etheniformans]
MTEPIFIGVAWPYANNLLHLGHVAGAYLPPDIFARYHRTKGDDVLMVSGSDQHGTPVTIRAETEGKSPAEVAAYYHQKFLESWAGLGITFDLYTTTGTPNHRAVVQDIFLKLLEKGYLYKDIVSQPYCPKCKRFLPDRYVEGVCPSCKMPGARGDQCDACGKPMNPADLINACCKLCGTPPEFRETEHFFLRLSAFQEPLLEWVKEQESHWRPNVQRFTRRYLEEGLRDRAITRDITWGIPVPLPGYENKRIYVWFEAVIGYLSASKEWAELKGDPEAWRKFWQEPCKSYYFIGKDNIPFHTIIWPAMLMGYGGLNLPYDVPSNEFLTIEAQKLSKSKNLAIWLEDFLSRYQPDALRYMLSVNMPDTSDTDFSWREFVRRNNDELVATYGNLVNRTLSMLQKHFEGRVPQHGALDERSLGMIARTEETLKTMDELLYACRFKEAIKAAMALASETNRYLDEKAPWKTVKMDKAAAADGLYTALCVISGLRTAFYPFLPFSSERLHRFLGYEGTIQADGWKLRRPVPGADLNTPEALYIKLDESIIEDETARMGLTST